MSLNDKFYSEANCLYPFLWKYKILRQNITKELQHLLISEPIHKKSLDFL